MPRRKLTAEDRSTRRQIRLERFRRSALGELAISNRGEAVDLAKEALAGMIAVHTELSDPKPLDPDYVRRQLKRVHTSWVRLASWSKWLSEGSPNVAAAS